MAASYEIWMADPTGRKMRLLDKYIRMDALRVANGIGVLTLELSDNYDQLLKLDNIIEVWRRPENGMLSLFDAYFVRGWSFESQSDGDVTVITGLNGNDLLRRRIVAYDAGSSETSKTDYADDMMKELVAENLGSSATDTDRDWSDAGFDVEVDLSAAPSITMAFAWQNVLNVCQKIADASRVEGTRLYFEVRPIPASGSTLSWEFRTAIDQLGLDHTGSDQITFGEKWGNLEESQLTYDYTADASVIYSGGAGLEDERVVVEVEDTVRSGGSPWSRVERFYNCAGQAGEDTDTITAAGQAALNDARPKLRFNGTIREGLTTRFGVDWGFGDLVMITHRGLQFEAVITAVQISLDGDDGDENVSGRFEIL